MNLVTKFHGAHALFCICYCAQYVIIVAHTQSLKSWEPGSFMERCSDWWALYDVNALFQNLTLCLFFNYWHAVYTASSDRATAARSKIYGALVLLWLAGEIERSGAGSRCGPKNKDLLMRVYSVTNFVWFVDCVVVTCLVVREHKESLSICFKGVRSALSWHVVVRRTFGRIAPFCLLLLSLLIANIITAAEFLRDVRESGFDHPLARYSGWSTFKLLLILQIPSIITLLVMWKRRWNATLVFLAVFMGGAGKRLMCLF